ncbi:MAG: porin [Tolumonas sp.]|nr:MAG: porin [Tolumonas sp.]
MKKLTAVAIALLAATQANAAEVYKNEKVSLDLNGRAYAGHYFGTKEKAGTPGEKSEKIGANQFIRFGAKGDAVVSGTMKAIGVYEAQLNIGNSEKTLNGDKTDTVTNTDGEEITVTTSDSNDGNLRTRLAYGGLKDENWGQATFGRQKGAVSLISDWTDKSLTDGYGNEALGVATDTYATGRAADVVKYSGVFGADKEFMIDASYKFDGDTKEETGGNTNDSKSADAYGIAAAYNLPMNFSIGTGYNVGKFESKGESTDAKLWIIGAKYDDKATYVGVNYAKGTDFVGVDKDHTGIEAVAGYDFVNGFGLMAMYNNQTVEQSGKEDVDTVKYYTLGAQYKFNKNLRLAAEYRINDKDTDSKYDYKNDMQLAVRYDF